MSRKALLTIVTTPKLTGGKKNPHQGRVTKVTTNLEVEYNENGLYQKRVREALVEEGKDPGDYVEKPRRWGTRVGTSATIEHNGNTYVEVIIVGGGNTHYELDGYPIDKEDVIGLPPAPQEAEQGGLEEKVILRTINHDNIRAIKGI